MAIVKDFEVPVVFRRSVAVVKSFRDLIVFQRSEVPVVQKPSALSCILRQEKKSSSPLSECRREREEVLLAFERVKARLKVLSASRGEEMYTMGKLRHQRKSFSPQSEFRQDETEKSGVFVTLNGGKGRSMENAFCPLSET